MQAHPDAVLPRKVYSLRQFNNLVYDIHEGVRGLDPERSFVNATLAGRYFSGREERRIYVDAMRGLQDGHLVDFNDEPGEGDYQMTRDYDSIIGYTDGLPYNVPLAVYVVPPFKQGLRKDLHIKVRCTIPAVSLNIFSALQHHLQMSSRSG